MEFGVTFPQTDIEPDPEQIATFARTVEEIGYEHVLAYDHILGVEPPREDWDGTYDYTDPFLEPFVLFSHLAAVTTDIDFVTGVLVLPQRESPLVAKQAATLDALCDGQFILGVGVGWNDIEYRNLGMDFETRGARIEEQIDVVRELWQHDLIEYDGEWHHIEDAGINPRPANGSIPVWIGGGADAVLRRIARQGDGWIAPTVPMDEFETKVKALRTYLTENGRRPDEFPIHARIKLANLGPDDYIDRIEAFERLGVSHVGIGTMNMGLSTADEHLEALTEFMSDLRDAGWK